MEREFLQGVDHALYIDFGTYQRWGKLLGGLLLAKESEKGTWRRRVRETVPPIWQLQMQHQQHSHLQPNPYPSPVSQSDERLHASPLPSMTTSIGSPITSSLTSGSNSALPLGASSGMENLPTRLRNLLSLVPNPTSPHSSGPLPHPSSLSRLLPTHQHQLSNHAIHTSLNSDVSSVSAVRHPQSHHHYQLSTSHPYAPRTPSSSSSSRFPRRSRARSTSPIHHHNRLSQPSLHLPPLPNRSPLPPMSITNLPISNLSLPSSNANPSLPPMANLPIRAQRSDGIENNSLALGRDARDREYAFTFAPPVGAPQVSALRTNVRMGDGDRGVCSSQSKHSSPQQPRQARQLEARDASSRVGTKRGAADSDEEDDSDEESEDEDDSDFTADEEERGSNSHPAIQFHQVQPPQFIPYQHHPQEIEDSRRRHYSRSAGSPPRTVISTTSSSRTGAPANRHKIPKLDQQRDVRDNMQLQLSQLSIAPYSNVNGSLISGGASRSPPLPRLFVSSTNNSPESVTATSSSGQGSALFVDGSANNTINNLVVVPPAEPTLQRTLQAPFAHDAQRFEKSRTLPQVCFSLTGSSRIVADYI